MPAGEPAPIHSRAVWAVLAVAAVLFTIPIAKPLYLDNMDFPAVAKATAETGLPLYYRGEESPRHSGLYHPPLYIYVLAAWFRLWGFGAVQARLLGFVLLAAQGWLVLFGLRLLFGAGRAREAAPWFWALFLLSPFALQGAAVLDIDTAVYGPLLTAMLLAALRLRWLDGSPREQAPRARDYALLSAAAAAALWAKLTTVLAFIPAAALLAAGGRDGARIFARALGALAAGMAVFLSSYFAFGWLTGLDVLYTFRFTFMSLQQRVHEPGLMEKVLAHARTFRDMAIWQLMWSGLLPWAGALAAAGWAWWTAWRRKDRRWRDAAVILGLALFVTAAYCAILYTYGRSPFKYVFVVWGVVAACLSLAAAAAAERIRPQSAAARKAGAVLLAVVLACCFAAGARLLRDRMILEGQIHPEDRWALLLPALAGTAGVLLWRYRPGPWLLMAGLLSHTGLMTGVALAMARAPYPTTYDYGQQGFERTACFLSENTAPEDRIISMKDIGFHIGRRYFENYGYVYSGERGADAMRAILDSGRARFAVFTEGNGPDDLRFNPPLQQVIRDSCTLTRSYGHYRIYDCAKARRAQERPAVSP